MNNTNFPLLLTQVVHFNFVSSETKFFKNKADKNIIELNENTKSVIDNLDRFFIICKRSVNFDFIKIEDIVSKCVLLQHNDEYFVSIFNETDEIID